MTDDESPGQPSKGGTMRFWNIVGRGTLSGVRGYGGLHLIFSIIPFAWGLMLTGLVISPVVGFAFGVCAAALTRAMPPRTHTPTRRLLSRCLLVALGMLTYFQCGALEMSANDPAAHTLAGLLGPWPALQECYGRTLHASHDEGALFYILVCLPAAVGGLSALRLGLWIARQAPPPPSAPAVRALSGLSLGVYAASSGALLLSGVHRAARLPLDEQLLDAAAHGGQATESAAALLRLGASANAVDSDGNTAFELALQDNDPETVGLLLDHGARLDGGALIWSLETGQPSLARVLIAHGADPNAVGPNGEAALTVARQSRASGIAAPRTPQDRRATRRSYDEVIRLLLRGGARP